MFVNGLLRFLPGLAAISPEFFWGAIRRLAAARVAAVTRVINYLACSLFIAGRPFPATSPYLRKNPETQNPRNTRHRHGLHDPISSLSSAVHPSSSRWALEIFAAPAFGFFLAKTTWGVFELAAAVGPS